jgi:hypothetical protein
MKPLRATLASLVLATAALAAAPTAFAAPPAPGFTSLFNGRDLAGWKIPQGDNGHWKVLNGVIDYDARSEAKGDKNLWSEKEYGDFVLRLDWRIKETPALWPIPEVLPDGSYKLGADGEPIKREMPNADSGVLLRGTSKAQLNIWCWPIGSGEVFGYRMDKKMPPEVRAGVTPKLKADKPVGEWNTFEITMRGDRLTVVLNGKTVIDQARLPDIPPRGPIALQHHGQFKDGKYNGAASLVQFRNISIKEL